MAPSQRVLLILGPGRSGSTLIERILGNQAGYFSVGEVRYFWEYIYNDYRLCGCGSRINECAFWQRVIREIDQADTLDVDRLAAISKRVNRTAFLPLLVHFQGPFLPLINELTAGFQQLFDSISQNLPEPVIVDSSKIASYANLLLQVPNLDLRVLHLVRDSRAVAYSWKYRKKSDPSRSDQGGVMKERGLLRSAITWLMTNCYILEMKSSFNSYALLRYEDFVDNPTASLNSVLAELDLPEIAMDLDKPFQLLPTHSIGGNPLRFEKQFSIRERSAWCEKLNGFQKYWIGLFTYPLLRKFNYHIKCQRSR